MKKAMGTALFGAAAVIVVIGAFQLGLLRFNPTALLPDVTSEVSRVENIDSAEITELHAIWLDCRARVHATVPITGTKEHKLLGQVYRTDTIELAAIGDVDTCVEGDRVQISRTLDGRHSVVVPADAIVFNRPRVDAVATRDSVEFDKGLVGTITDSFPWVSQSEGLTAGAYAFAQQVVGGSACMEAAYEVTEQMLIDAYRTQLEAQGLDPADVEVRIDGTPDFGQNGPVGLDDFDFSVDDDAVSCAIADGLGINPVDGDDSRDEV